MSTKCELIVINMVYCIANCTLNNPLLPPCAGKTATPTSVKNYHSRRVTGKRYLLISVIIIPRVAPGRNSILITLDRKSP